LRNNRFQVILQHKGIILQSVQTFIKKMRIDRLIYGISSIRIHKHLETNNMFYNMSETRDTLNNMFNTYPFETDDGWFTIYIGARVISGHECGYHANMCLISKKYNTLILIDPNDGDMFIKGAMKNDDKKQCILYKNELDPPSMSEFIDSVITPYFDSMERRLNKIYILGTPVLMGDEDKNGIGDSINGNMNVEWDECVRIHNKNINTQDEKCDEYQGLCIFTSVMLAHVIVWNDTDAHFKQRAHIFIEQLLATQQPLLVLCIWLTMLHLDIDELELEWMRDFFKSDALPI
jgi:hypothetical protein